MRRALAAWPAAAALCLLSTPATAGGDRSSTASVHWGRAHFEPPEWPVELPYRARRTVEAWSAWAARAGYRMDLDAGARVLVLSEERSHRSMRREMEVVEKAADAFDALAASPPQPTSGDTTPGELPVLVRLHDEGDYRELLAHLEGVHVRQRGVLRSARDARQLTLASPACTLWVEGDVPDRRVDHDLAHRAARTLLRARYGDVPGWMGRGVAWNVEEEACRTIKSFPGRPDLARSAAPRSWERRVRGQADGDEVVGVEALSIPADSYAEEDAALAWSFVRFLERHRPGALGPILMDLAGYAEASRDLGEVAAGEPAPVPTTVQDRILRRGAGDDVFEAFAAFLREGSRYRGR